jgi:hypothetical protein
MPRMVMVGILVEMFTKRIRFSPVQWQPGIPQNDDTSPFRAGKLLTGCLFMLFFKKNEVKMLVTGNKRRSLAGQFSNKGKV